MLCSVAEGQPDHVPTTGLPGVARQTLQGRDGGISPGRCLQCHLGLQTPTAWPAQRRSSAFIVWERVETNQPCLYNRIPHGPCPKSWQPFPPRPPKMTGKKRHPHLCPPATKRQREQKEEEIFTDKILMREGLGRQLSRWKCLSAT